MAYIKGGPRINRHVSFTPEEDSKLRQRAAKVGMEVVPFIREEALHGTVRGFPLAPINQHAEAIGQIAQAVRKVADRQHPDRWLYEADLEEIENKLAEILAIEKDIQERLRQRMK